jgi:hypothetical protein
MRPVLVAKMKSPRYKLPRFTYSLRSQIRLKVQREILPNGDDIRGKVG